MIENLADLRHTHKGQTLAAAIDAYLESNSTQIGRRTVLEFVAPLFDQDPDDIALQKVVRGWNQLHRGEQGPEAQRLAEEIEKISPLRISVWRRIDFLRSALVGSVKGLGERMSENNRLPPVRGTASSEALMAEIDQKLVELCGELGRRLPARHERAKATRKRKLGDALSWLRSTWIPSWEKVGQISGLGAVERELCHRLVQAVWQNLSEFFRKSGGVQAPWPGSSEPNTGVGSSRDLRFSSGQVGALILLFSAAFASFAFAAVSRWGLLASFDVNVAAASTVLVQTPSGVGSGFLVEGGRFIITNQHVVGSFDQVSIEVKSSGSDKSEARQIDARVLARDPGEDLAVLEIQDVNAVADLPRGLSLAVEPTVRTGDQVHILGNPLGMRDIYAQGTVIKVDPEQHHVLVDAMIAPGNSGGPVCNARGEVVAVTTAYVKPKSQTSFDYGVAVLSSRAWLLLSSVQDRSR